MELVFPNEVGKPENSNNMVKRGFIPALRRANLPQIRFHDLRHTYASLLIKQGEHPKYIQGQLGHSSIKVTMDTYGHFMEDTNHEAAKRLGIAIFGDNGSRYKKGHRTKPVTS
jgi:integrase